MIISFKIELFLFVVVVLHSCRHLKTSLFLFSFLVRICLISYSQRICHLLILLLVSQGTLPVRGHVSWCTSTAIPPLKIDSCMDLRRVNRHSRLLQSHRRRITTVNANARTKCSVIQRAVFSLGRLGLCDFLLACGQTAATQHVLWYYY